MNGRHTNKFNYAMLPCEICEAASTGIHYGAITCDACKHYFRLHHLKDLAQLQCIRGGGGCQIGVTARKCPRCRLLQCYRAGMAIEKSRSGNLNSEQKLKRGQHLRRCISEGRVLQTNSRHAAAQRRPGSAETLPPSPVSSDEEKGGVSAVSGKMQQESIPSGYNVDVMGYVYEALQLHRCACDAYSYHHDDQSALSSGHTDAVPLLDQMSHRHHTFTEDLRLHIRQWPYSSNNEVTDVFSITSLIQCHRWTLQGPPRELSNLAVIHEKSRVILDMLQQMSLALHSCQLNVTELSLMLAELVTAPQFLSACRAAAEQYLRSSCPEQWQARRHKMDTFLGIMKLAEREVDPVWGNIYGVSAR